jgi:hypothetical protein
LDRNLEEPLKRHTVVTVLRSGTPRGTAAARLGPAQTFAPFHISTPLYCRSRCHSNRNHINHLSLSFTDSRGEKTASPLISTSKDVLGQHNDPSHEPFLILTTPTYDLSFFKFSAKSSAYILLRPFTTFYPILYPFPHSRPTKHRQFGSLHIIVCKYGSLKPS